MKYNFEKNYLIFEINLIFFFHFRISIFLAIIKGQDPIFDDYFPANIQPGSKVNVYDSTGSTITARGVIDSQVSKKYRDFDQTVSASRVVVNIAEVIVQGALISIPLSKGKTKATRWSLASHITDHIKDLLIEKKNVRPWKPTPLTPNESSSLSVFILLHHHPPLYLHPPLHHHPPLHLHPPLRHHSPLRHHPPLRHHLLHQFLLHHHLVEREQECRTKRRMNMT